MEKEVKDYMKINGGEGKITEFIKKARFYNCISCNEIYFDGLGECAEVLNQDDPENKIKERKCKKCGVYGKKICPIHGDKYILIKCCYCCDVSVWKCGLTQGTTYFCEPCHSILKYEKKKCPGKEKCPLNADHPIVYGPENIFAIGCSRCLDDKLKQNLKWQFRKRY